MKHFSNKNRNKKVKKRGAMLVYALIVVSLVSIILAASMQMVVSHIRYGLTRESREEALQVAEAGIYFYRWYLAHEVDGLTKKQVRQFWASGSAYGVNTAYESDFNGVGKYSITVTPPEANSTIVIVKSVGWTYKYPDIKRTVQVRFRQPSWSEFAVLCDSNIRFGSGTETTGPIHSNGGIRFDGVAHNVISSSVSSYNDTDYDACNGNNELGVHTCLPPADPPAPNPPPSRPDVFEAGRVFPVVEKDFDSVLADIADMKSEAGCSSVGNYCSADHIVGSNGIYFNNNGVGRHIRLNTDGTFQVRTVQSYNTTFNNIINYSGSWQTFDIPDGGIIFVEGNVWVEGQIDNKMVTIVAADLSGGSDKSIFLQHDLKYTNYDGSDIIGLIAQGDVEVIKDSDNDLRIDAALLAQNGRVGRKYYSLVNTWWWGWITCPCGWTWCEDHKDTITIYGSIATKGRYGFAWGDSCPRSTGYTHRNLIYDNNLLYYPPPYFPTGVNYAIDLWDEK